MDFLSILLVFLIVICFGLFFYMYLYVSQMNVFISELSKLVSRTFREYYKGEDIEPVVINNGVDLIWKGDVPGSFNEDNKKGFITIMTNDGNINSPIIDLKEADIIAGKISNVVYDYVKDREEI